MSLILLYLSFNEQDWIENKQIGKIAVFSWSLCIISAISDIAIDGWVISLLTPECVTYGSVCQSFGQSSGWATSQFLFILLNSAKFCN
jgi:PAT family acetyl-CoA transporter-like MFS transporter 1